MTARHHFRSVRRLIALLHLGCVVLYAADYHVSPKGSDKSGDGSISRPWWSIQQAISVAQAGDAVYLREGIYRETIQLTRDGSVGQPIVVSAYPDETVSISGLDLLPGDLAWAQADNGIWNTISGCKWEATGHAGDIVTVYNNTVFVSNDNHPLLLSETQPEGDLLDRRTSIIEAWPIYNNVSFGIKYRYWFTYWGQVQAAGQPTSYYFDNNESAVFTHNRSLSNQDLASYFNGVELDTIDLRPGTGSPLIDSGAVVNGQPEESIGRPDQGAYEYGGEYWYPGANWFPCKTAPPETMACAVSVARALFDKYGGDPIITYDEVYIDPSPSARYK